MSTEKKGLSEQQLELLQLLEKRFANNMHRHVGVEWTNVRDKLVGRPDKLKSLHAMESSGGEPDVVEFDAKTTTYVFCDCSPESPKGRRSLCYDRTALETRKSFPPKDSAMEMATAMGIELLTEEQYRALQLLGEFDTKTSSWVLTPTAIRNIGGALFCDRRYDCVFVYHNGAESYYGVRGFRGALSV